MRRLSKFELNALNSLNKIEIQEKNNAELRRLQNQRKFEKKFIKTIFISIVIGGCIAGSYGYYYLKNKNHTQSPIKTIVSSKPYKHSSKYPYKKKPSKITDRNPYSKPHEKKSTVKQNATGKIHYWTDKKGTIHATNTGVPKNVSSVSVINEIDSFNKRTPVKIKNNNIYIPVTLHNNGVTIRTEMLLDTGCSSTVINSKLAQKLKLKKIRNIRSTVADGRTVKGAKAKVGFIKVGPYSEHNVEISYQKHAGSANKGLLGMDFLKKHPFSIDFENKAIIWE